MPFVPPLHTAPISSFSASTFAALAASVAATVIVAVLLPFMATFLLDALVLLARGKGAKPLVLVLALVIVTAAVGFGMLGFAQSGAEASATVFDSAGRFLLPWAVGLALVGFASRQVRQVARRR